MSDIQPTVLVIDDEPDILELLTLTLERMDLEVLTAASVKEAINRLNDNHFDLCLTDLRLPDGDGIEIVKFVENTYPQVPVAVISAHGNMQSAIDAMKAGAFDFVSKPIDLEQLRALIRSALALGKNEAAQCSADTTGPRLLGTSPPIEQIRNQIRKLARSLAPVHIHGESGTGKELVARLIHDCSPRMANPFIAVNSSAIPVDLMESEFFGHRKGSFTGAINDHPGLFLSASGGTLFLDEIADLPLSIQAKLLRAIQERAIRPVGSHEEIPIDCRILSATHQDLKSLVAAGKFREDLYYRINVIGLKVPPLRERPSDIPILAEFILARIAERNQDTSLQIEAEALDALTSYEFPGNIRELENILERAAALCENHVLSSDDLELDQPVKTGEPRISDLSSMAKGQTLDDYLQQVEKQVILDALEKNHHHITKTAETLGLSFRSLRYKLKKLGINGR